jgi:filamentous hemagglutinin family protein
LLLITVFQLFASARGNAEAASTITPTTGTGNLGTTVTQTGNVYGIKGGQTVGNNLYHSFGQFSVGTGATAQYQTTNLVPNASMQNILSRVTGGSPSSIFGMIDSATYYPNANFFFLNPAGILFGPNATINVGGMVAFTTADYLRLADGGRFNANPSLPGESLTIAPVAAFGFLGNNPSAIAIQGSTLQMAQGQSFTLVGGNNGFTTTDPDTGSPINVQGGVTIVGGMLSAPSGQINIISVASPGEISAVDFMPTTGMAMGPVNLSQGTTLDVSGDTGGTVRIRGGQLVMDQSFIYAGTFGDTGGAPTAVDINVTGAVQIRNASAIDVTGFGAGRSGDIEIRASNFSLTDGSYIANQNFGTGSAGNINLTINGSLTMAGMDQFGNGSLITTAGTGPDGTININAADVSISDSGRISLGSPAAVIMQVSNLTLSSGSSIETSGGDTLPSGDIHINASGNIALLGDGNFGTRILNQNNGAGGTGSIIIETGSLSLANRAHILSETTSLPGTPLTQQPKISITATDSVSVSGGSRIDLSNNLSSIGPLNINAKNISLSDQGLISSTTQGPGDAGTINIGTQQNLSLTGGSQINSLTRSSVAGNGGIVTIVAGDTLSLSGTSTAIQTSSLFNSPGNAGQVAITANAVNISNGALLSSTSASGATGSAGQVNIVAHQITVNTGSIQTTTAGPGVGGNIQISANDVTLQNGGTLSASSTGSGPAGTVTIDGTASPAQSVLIDGTGSGVFTTTSATGAGGSITVNANTVTLQNGGTLSAATSGTAPSATGGSITVNAAALTLNTGGNITASSTGAGAAGDVTVQCQCHNPAQSVLIDGHGSGIFTDTQGAGAGGNIFLNANAFTLQNGGMISAATSGPAATATGGTITINANQAQLNSGATITTATSGPGDAGSILVKADSVGMNGGATITASSTGSGAAGSVTIQGNAAPAQSIVIDGTGSGIFTDTQATGAGGSITTWSNQLQLSSGSTISSKTSGSGNAGNILVKADDITISGASAITAASTGSGNAGTVTIQGTHSPANSFVVDGFSSGIFTTTSNSGTGGNIVVNSNDVVLENGATISAKSSGNATTAVGGTITINAADTVTLNGATITASSSGVADAGSINITANNGLSMQGSSITTEAGQGAGGGNINVTTSPAATVILQNSTVSASVADGPGGGGNISIDPNYVILQNSQILARAADGQGGTISITAGLFLPDGNSVVNADSGSGVNGTVTIQSPVSPASGKIIPLQQTPLIAASIMTQRCAALTGGNFSTFTVAGRDTLPTEPGGWLSSPLTLATASEHKGLEATAEQETPLLSLRQIAPPGFLIQSFAVDSSGCQS